MVAATLFSTLLSGCASGPALPPPPPPVIAINTIPAGADISIRDNFIGQSPLTIPAPHNYTGTEPIKIEVRLEGYEPKEVMFGDYHPPVDQVLTKMVESDTMIYRAPAGTKTIPAYYTYGNSVTIKLYPLGK